MALVLLALGSRDKLWLLYFVLRMMWLEQSGLRTEGRMGSGNGA